MLNCKKVGRSSRESSGYGAERNQRCPHGVNQGNDRQCLFAVSELASNAITVPWPCVVESALAKNNSLGSLRRATRVHNLEPSLAQIRHIWRVLIVPCHLNMPSLISSPAV